jgi:hypothetical protein
VNIIKYSKFQVRTALTEPGIYFAIHTTKNTAAAEAAMTTTMMMMMMTMTTTTTINVTFQISTSNITIQ